jgi:hypothetical protein
MAGGDYGEKFEGPLIVCMLLVIAASLAGAVALVSSHRPSCRTSNMDYCGHDSSF